MMGGPELLRGKVAFTPIVEKDICVWQSAL